MKIFKYPFVTQDVIIIPMHQNAKILCVQLQNGVPCIWALVDENEKIINHKFRIYGTGHSIDELGTYVGTYQLYGGNLIFHVFDIGL